MPQSLSLVIVHLIFSTKDRCSCLAEFQEEYRDLLSQCGIEFDERYVWD
jgi:hypothetical protein